MLQCVFQLNVIKAQVVKMHYFGRYKTDQCGFLPLHGRCSEMHLFIFINKIWMVLDATEAGVEQGGFNLGSSSASQNLPYTSRRKELQYKDVLCRWA